MEKQKNNVEMIRFEIVLHADNDVTRVKALERFGPCWKADGFWKFKQKLRNIRIQILQNGIAAWDCVLLPCVFQSGYEGFRYDGASDDFEYQLRLTHTSPKAYGILATVRRKEIYEPKETWRPYADNWITQDN